MVTYKNDYTKNEDETLWEIHEIRHKIYEELKDKSITEINKSALKKFENWKKKRKLAIV